MPCDAAAGTRPLPVIIDTDPGIDDAIALLLALAAPELEVLAVTTVAGNAPLGVTFNNARQICALAGRADVPVYAGCGAPVLREPIRGKFSGSGGLGSLSLPAPTAPVQTLHAVDYLIETLMAARANSRKITLCVLGPLTNLAVALRKQPDIVEGLQQVLIMGGAAREAGNRTCCAEFNILSDPHAAHIVFNSSINLQLFPLDVTHRAMTTAARLRPLHALRGPVADAVRKLFADWDRKDSARFGSEGGPLHDPLVIAALLRPTLFGGYSAFVQVELSSPLTLGQTVVDRWNTSNQPHNLHIADTVDADGFFELLWQRLSSYHED